MKLEEFSKKLKRKNLEVLIEKAKKETNELLLNKLQLL
jgi:hypothetical protein